MGNRKDRIVMLYIGIAHVHNIRPCSELFARKKESMSKQGCGVLEWCLLVNDQYDAEQRNLVVSNDETLSYAGRVHSISFAGQDHSRLTHHQKLSHIERRSQCNKNHDKRPRIDLWVVV